MKRQFLQSFCSLCSEPQPITEQTQTLEQEILLQKDASENASANQKESEALDSDEVSGFDEKSEQSSDSQEHTENEENYPELDDDTPEGFIIHKAEREIVLLEDLQSWLAARCVQLGDIEVFAGHGMMTTIDDEKKWYRG